MTRARTKWNYIIFSNVGGGVKKIRLVNKRKWSFTKYQVPWSTFYGTFLVPCIEPSHRGIVVQRIYLDWTYRKKWSVLYRSKSVNSNGLNSSKEIHISIVYIECRIIKAIKKKKKSNEGLRFQQRIYSGGGILGVNNKISDYRFRSHQSTAPTTAKPRATEVVRAIKIKSQF